MATSSSTVTPACSGSSAGLPAPFDASELIGVWLRTQQLPLTAMLAWQQSMVAVQRELWDEWICRWGGGVPIDG